MEIIGIILLVALIGLLLLGLVYVGLGIFGFWPMILGIVGCIFLWKNGHDNLGVLTLIAGGVGMWPWFNWLGKGQSSGDVGNDRSETAEDILRDIRNKL